MNIDLLIFDCDGVLVDSETIGNRVIAEELATLGINIPQEEIIRHFAGNYLKDSLLTIQEATGIRFSVDEFTASYRQKSYQVFQNELQPIPGINELVQKLALPFCVASNGPRSKIELNLSLTNLLPHFENRIYSAYELDIWKPDPAFYLEVCRAMNVRPEQSLVVEDSRFGVRSAVGAGIPVIGYAAGNDDKAAELEREGAKVINDMSQLANVLGLS